MKTSLIIGANGFLGHHIAQSLKERSYRVSGIIKGAGADISLLDTVREMTLPSPELVTILRDQQPDIVVFAAGTASVASSMTNPVADFDQNVNVFLNVLESVRQSVPSTRVILLSSAAVYGNPIKLPISEDQPLQPVSPYGSHKRICELLAKEYADIYGLNVCSLRIFSAYGNGLDRQVMWDIARQVVQSGEVRLFGTGDESRDFIHAMDVARAVIVAAEQKQDGWHMYNVASGREVTIRNLAEMLANNINPDVKIIFSGEVRPGDPLNWRADISKIQGIGFSPQVSFEDGIAAYSKWAVEKLNSQKS